METFENIYIYAQGKEGGLLFGVLLLVLSRPRVLSVETPGERGVSLFIPFFMPSFFFVYNMDSFFVS